MCSNKYNLPEIKDSRLEALAQSHQEENKFQTKFQKINFYYFTIGFQKCVTPMCIKFTTRISRR
jgi:hypothetical protein